MPYSFTSGLKYRWKIPSFDNSQDIASLAAACNVSFPIAQTLLTRGHTSLDTIHDFITCPEDKLVPHASRLKDAERTVDRILAAIEKQENILICGDYDVDGITSTSLMMICLLPLQARINFFLPHRVRDGYGISTALIERAARNNYSLVITVDNGITAHAQAEKARACSIDLIITDHHRPHETLPDAYAIVNPNQADCPYPFKSLAGVGVTFKILSLLYEKKKLQLPPKAYELLLLGTVADVVPLVEENRFWVRYCLHSVNAHESRSLTQLKLNGNVQTPTITSRDVGFAIAPQINALGRLEDPRQAVQFLIGTDPDNVKKVGLTLQTLNEARKKIERSIFEGITRTIESGSLDITKNTVILASSNEWPPGVIGLVASRCVSAYGRPTILLHETNAGILKGSCRSIPELSIFDVLQQCHDLLLQFGGHAQAAGLSLRKENLSLFQEKLEKIVATLLTPEDLQQKIVVDGHASLSDVNQKIIHDLNLLEPFGHHNSEPLFLFESVTLIQKPQLLKDLHVKCTIACEGIVKPVIFFNRPDIYSILEKLYFSEVPSFSLIATVKENNWNSRKNVELTGVDIAIIP